MSEHAPGSEGSTAIDLPLRGLASEGAGERVGPPLLAIPGVLDVAVHASEFRVRVSYNPTRVSPEVIREQLHGIVEPDTAHGSARPPTSPATGDGA